MMRILLWRNYSQGAHFDFEWRASWSSGFHTDFHRSPSLRHRVRFNVETKPTFVNCFGPGYLWYHRRFRFPIHKSFRYFGIRPMAIKLWGRGGSISGDGIFFCYPRFVFHCWTKVSPLDLHNLLFSTMPRLFFSNVTSNVTFIWD